METTDLILVSFLILMVISLMCFAYALLLRSLGELLYYQTSSAKSLRKIGESVSRLEESLKVKND